MRELYRRLPPLQRLSRAGDLRDCARRSARGITRDRRWLKAMELNARAPSPPAGPGPRAAQAAHAGLRDLLQADHPVERRGIPRSRQPNVELVSSGVRGAARALDRRRGRRRARDRHADLRHRLQAGRAADRERASTGATGARSRRSGAAALRRTSGTTVAGFPNLLLLYGPNPNLGHNSIVYMLESQMNYAIGRAAHDARDRRRRVRGAPRGPGRLQRGAPGAARHGPSGTPAAAEAGTSTATAATRSSGPASRSSTAAARGASTPRPTGWPRRRRCRVGFAYRGLGGAGSVTW